LRSREPWPLGEGPSRGSSARHAAALHRSLSLHRGEAAPAREDAARVGPGGDGFALERGEKSPRLGLSTALFAAVDILWTTRIRKENNHFAHRRSGSNGIFYSSKTLAILVTCRVVQRGPVGHVRLRTRAWSRAEGTWTTCAGPPGPPALTGPSPDATSDAPLRDFSEFSWPIRDRQRS